MDKYYTLLNLMDKYYTLTKLSINLTSTQTSNIECIVGRIPQENLLPARVMYVGIWV